MSDITTGRTIGSDIYPTEDELYEAYLVGQIDYQTYLNLREIYNSDIDSTELYLIDEVPNINFFTGHDYNIYSDLEKEQSKPYISEEIKISKSGLYGSAKWKRNQKLDETGSDQSRVFIKSRLSENWSFRLNGSDEFYEHQEFSFRSLNYKNRNGPIRKLTIGNFTTRFGLGVTVGYRGRLIDKNYLSPEKTLLCPDYGGFNGLYAESNLQNTRIKWFFHYDKNDTILIRATALNFKRIFGSYRVEGTLLGSIISNRLTKNEFRQSQIGFLLGYSRKDFEGAVEAVLPKNNSERSSKDNQAAVAEMSYRRNDFGFKFSTWYYGQNYINLFGGGRSGDLYRTIELDSVDLNYRDRRNYQRGFLVRSSTSLSARSDAEMSFSVYGSSRYNRFIEIQTSWGKIIGEKTRLRLYYELFRKEKLNEVLNNNSIKLEYNHKSSRFSFRSFLGYNYESRQKKYLSQLFCIKIKNKILKEIEFWVNFGRINIETTNIDYFYCYIKEMAEVTETVSLAVKYRYRYNRRFAEPNESTIYLETSVVW